MSDGCDFCNGRAAARGSTDTHATLSGDIMSIKCDLTDDLDNIGVDYDWPVVELLYAYRINFCPYCGKPVWRGTAPWSGWR